MEKELQKLEPSDRDVIIIRVDENITSREINDTVNAFQNALKSIEPSPAFIIMPRDMDVENIPERKMNNMGWYKRVDEGEDN